jgi:hypothetical protein
MGDAPSSHNPPLIQDTSKLDISIRNMSNFGQAPAHPASLATGACPGYAHSPIFEFAMNPLYCCFTSFFAVLQVEHATGLFLGFSLDDCPSVSPAVTEPPLAVAGADMLSSCINARCAADYDKSIFHAGDIQVLTCWITKRCSARVDSYAPTS